MPQNESKARLVFSNKSETKHPPSASRVPPLLLSLRARSLYSALFPVSTAKFAAHSLPARSRRYSRRPAPQIARSRCPPRFPSRALPIVYPAIPTQHRFLSQCRCVVPVTGRVLFYNGSRTRPLRSRLRPARSRHHGLILQEPEGQFGMLRCPGGRRARENNGKKLTGNVLPCRPRPPPGRV